MPQWVNSLRLESPARNSFVEWIDEKIVDISIRLVDESSDMSDVKAGRMTIAALRHLQAAVYQAEIDEETINEHLRQI